MDDETETFDWLDLTVVLEPLSITIFLMKGTHFQDFPCKEIILAKYGNMKIVSQAHG